MALDAISLAAPITGGLAALAFTAGVLPAARARRSAKSRLDLYVGGQAKANPRPTANSRRRLLPSDRPGWLAGRELPLLLFILGPATVQLLTGQVLLTIAATFQVLMFSTLVGQELLTARQRLLDNQTLPTVLRLAATMRAGASLGQAMQAVAQDGPSPTRDEFAQAMRQIALGTSIDAALDNLARRIGTADYAILSHVMTVQRRVGGNLALVLDSVADTIRERIDVRKQVATLTAQQRLSTWILVALPYVVVALFFVADASFLTPLFKTELGQGLLLAAAVLQTVGAWSLRLAGKIPT